MMVPPIRLDLQLGGELELVADQAVKVAGHLDGWGSLQASAARHAVYPGLGGRGPRTRVQWIVRGSGTARLVWTAPRAGSGAQEFSI